MILLLLILQNRLSSKELFHQSLHLHIIQEVAERPETKLRSYVEVLGLITRLDFSGLYKKFINKLDKLFHHLKK